MRVSVIVNNYNYGGYVAEAVDSALGQSHEDTEVVVVDDGSSDESREVLASYTGRIELVLKANGGQGSAFNAGLAASSGDVVIFLDADDRLHPKTVARAAAAFEADPDLVRLQYLLQVVDETGHPAGATVPAHEPELRPVDLQHRLLTTPDDIYWQPTSGNAFRRTALERIFPVPEAPYRICADYYLSNLTPYLGVVDALAGPGGDYRVHQANSEWSSELRLDRIRDSLIRTIETRRHAREMALATGRNQLPADPLRVRSVSFSARRLLSRRLAPSEHPFAGDRVAGIVRAGILSSLQRRDRSWLFRTAAIGWFVIAGLAPRRTLRGLARPLLRPSFRRSDLISFAFPSAAATASAPAAEPNR